MSMLKQVTQEGLLGRRMNVVKPPDGVKMSEVLLSFAGPYLEQTETPEQYQTYLMLAATAWNATMSREAQVVLDAQIARFPRCLRAEMRSLATEMIARRQTQYAHYDRGIVSFFWSELPDGSDHLAVGSSVGPPPTTVLTFLWTRWTLLWRSLLPWT